MTRADIACLLEGREPQEVRDPHGRDARVLIATGGYIPTELTRVLSEFFALRPAVRLAYAGRIRYEDPPVEEGYLIVVVADDRDEALRGYGWLDLWSFAGGDWVQLKVVAPTTRQHSLSEAAPFYVRSGLVAPPSGFEGIGRIVH
jgi:hypothetical protein